MKHLLFIFLSLSLSLSLRAGDFTAMQGYRVVLHGKDQIKAVYCNSRDYSVDIEGSTVNMVFNENGENIEVYLLDINAAVYRVTLSVEKNPLFASPQRLSKDELKQLETWFNIDYTIPEERIMKFRTQQQARKKLKIYETN